MIVKKDGRREAYDRMKVVAGVRKACEKRPISMEEVDAATDRIEKLLQEEGRKEVSSSVIGEGIMRELYDLDKVAYVRFASVYRSFRDLDEFMRELEDLLQSRRSPRKAGSRAKKA